MRDINYHKSKTIHGGVSTGSNFSWRAVADSESAACDSYDTTTTSNFHITSTNISLGAYWKVYGYAA